MGRHRPDPRGHARILIALLAVALVLALLVIGGIALFDALTSGSKREGAGVSSPTDRPVSASVTTSVTRRATGHHALALRVAGAPTKVYVQVSGTHQVLLNRVLGVGDVRYYDQAPLDVLVADGSAVRISIYGHRKPLGRRGQHLQWHVARM